jgi:hypothetical protein
MDWRALLHNKWFLGAGAAVTGVGGYVLWQRKKTTGSSSTAADVSGTGTGTGTGSTFDSSGTDLAAALGNFEQAYGNQMDDYQKSLQDILDQLKKVPTGGSGGGTGGTGGSGGNGGTGAGAGGGGGVHIPNGEQFTRVTKYSSSNPAWSSTLSGIAGHFGTSVSNLMKLNPQIKNPNLIYSGQQIRYR